MFAVKIYFTPNPKRQRFAPCLISFYKGIKYTRCSKSSRNRERRQVLYDFFYSSFDKNCIL